MKRLRYTVVAGKVNRGTEEEPCIEQILQPIINDCRNETFDVHYTMALKEAYNGEVMVEEISLTAEEARAQRDKLLLETDWTQVLDAPISAESREAFRVYRQALRDITEQESFPEVIDWPVKPEVVKAAPDPVDTALDVLIGEEEG